MPAQRATTILPTPRAVWEADHRVILRLDTLFQPDSAPSQIGRGGAKIMRMKLYAISDLHIAHATNRDQLLRLRPHPEDWLILAGDVGERPEQLACVFETLNTRFARLIWVPGNHELWTVDRDPAAPRGEAKYRQMVGVARDHGVLTPEDDYPLWTGPGGPCVITPLFLLYDYSFRPDDVAEADVPAWAAEERAACADEIYLSPEPHDSRAAWCRARLAVTEARLSALPPDLPTVLVNHFPLRRDLVRIPRIPRFAPWCGTRATEDWHRRFNARVVVSGHLHVRRTDWRDGVRFEEVSLGSPRQWDHARGVEAYLREILPG